MNAGKLFLSFSAPVVAKSFDPTRLHLQSTRRATAAAEFVFSTSTTTSSSDGTIVQVDISQSDFNALRMIQGVAKSAGSTFVSMDSGTFFYTIEGCIAGVGHESCPAQAMLPPVLTSDAMQVGIYQADTTRPALLGFSLDLPRRLVKLRFSKSVDMLSVNIAGVTFSDTASGANRYSLTSSSKVFRPDPDPFSGALLFDNNRLPADGTYVTLLIGEVDAASISSVGNGQIGISGSSTFIAVTQTFIRDYANPPNTLVPVGQATPAVFLRVSATDCTACPTGSYLVSSCSDLRDRVCAACSVCPTNSYALSACTTTSDTTCYRKVLSRAGILLLRLTSCCDHASLHRVPRRSVPIGAVHTHYRSSMHYVHKVHIR